MNGGYNMALISCPECGKQISTKAISCPNCGWVVEKSEKNITKTSSELDRSALLLYLSRIRELQSIKSDNDEKINAANMTYNQYASFVPTNYPYKPRINLPIQPSKPVLYKVIFIFSIIMLIGGIIGYSTIEKELESQKNLPKTNSQGIEIAYFNLADESDKTSCQFVIGCSLFGIICTLLLRKDGFKKYNAELNQYETEKQQYENIMRSYDEECGKINMYNQKMLEEKERKPMLIQQDINEISACNSRVQAHLNNLYSQNIIPKQMRDIYGAYYLYDYLSSSNQSLSEALIQYNLETIKQQLMEMIQLNKQMVIQQAITNSKLDDIQIGNSEMLSTLQRLETNSELSLKYSQINAENSAIAADLANESLAYNKAAFWMDEYDRLTR